MMKIVRHGAAGRSETALANCLTPGTGQLGLKIKTKIQSASPSWSRSFPFPCKDNTDTWLFPPPSLLSGVPLLTLRPLSTRSRGPPSLTQSSSRLFHTLALLPMFSLYPQMFFTILILISQNPTPHHGPQEAFPVIPSSAFCVHMNACTKGVKGTARQCKAGPSRYTEIWSHTLLKYWSLSLSAVKKFLFQGPSVCPSFPNPSLNSPEPLHNPVTKRFPWWPFSTWYSIHLNITPTYMYNLPPKLNADLHTRWHRTDINYEVGCSFSARSTWNTWHRASLEQTVKYSQCLLCLSLLSHGPAHSGPSTSSCCPCARLPYYASDWTPSDSHLPQTPSPPPWPSCYPPIPLPLLHWHNLEASSPLHISSGPNADKPNPNLPETGLGSSFLD